jgi:hypothetical protein
VKWEDLGCRLADDNLMGKTLTPVKVSDLTMETLPASQRTASFVLLANIAPALQMHVLNQMRRPRFVNGADGCRRPHCSEPPRRCGRPRPSRRWRG